MVRVHIAYLHRFECTKCVDHSSSSISTDEWVAVVSGLYIGSPSPSDMQLQMLVEYLVGEGGGVKEQVSAGQISRLIIAGNSLADVLPNGRAEIGEAEQKGKAVRLDFSSTFDLFTDLESTAAIWK